MADSMSVQANLRAALDSAHYILEGTMADVTDEVANAPAPGRANSAGSSYAHAVIAEDAIVNGYLGGRAPLLMTTWAGRTGVDKPMPMPGMLEGDLGEWYHSVRVNVAACREYALHHDVFGVWGGTSRHTRLILQRAQGIDPDIGLQGLTPVQATKGG